eukprot:CAMPEP_0182432880 /NCGR_PEP_ID=MMETSP1167-20130531/59583_1 /TAXON_ID=2988 /ORGANISM="Mallomonas Sp, Strain CCMP3275" /LENGTH=219 /DNA_ID=CAMNT_0024620937 /DNA_START=30 /DNA_END=689 /DNA_ORIENTATION=-
MLISFGFAYAAAEVRNDIYAIANYSLSFYASHVLIIFISSNVIFWLKEIDPRFKTLEDEGYDELPTLKEYRIKIEAEKALGGHGRGGFLVENLTHELSALKHDMDHFIETADVSSILPTGSHERGIFRLRSPKKSTSASNLHGQEQTNKKFDFDDFSTHTNRSAPEGNFVALNISPESTQKKLTCITSGLDSSDGIKSDEVAYIANPMAGTPIQGHEAI